MICLAQRQLSIAFRHHPLGTCRYFALGLCLESGHSRWSKIKHDKGKEDALKSKQRSTLVQDLTVASKQSGPDPSYNAKLAALIAVAKKSGLAKESIQTAIARGQGTSLNGDALESVTFEVMMKPAAAFIIECQTDNKARTTQELRDIFKYFKATTTPTAYMFKKKGKIILRKLHAVDEEEIYEQAIEAGVLDIEIDKDGKTVTVWTDPMSTSTVANTMTTGNHLELENLDIVWDAQEDMKASIDSAEEIERIENFIDRLQENSSVQDVYVNLSED